MKPTIPNSVRYVKNGQGGSWWPTAKAAHQLHVGWAEVPGELLAALKMDEIEPLVRAYSGNRRGATQNVKALETLLVRPSQHVWVTFEDGSLWWCTVEDEPHINPSGESANAGHFWLNCSRPWSNMSIDGKRSLVMAQLPGNVTKTAGFQATVCNPGGAKDILRIIRNEEDSDARDAILARVTYEVAVGKLIARLRPKDFEVLVDLILARTGWNRLQKIGGVTEGTDIEVENVTSDEVAFVQVKSTAGQAVLNDYVERYNARREQYQRMIFVVHSPRGKLAAPTDPTVAVWGPDVIAHRVVKLGLGDWVAGRL